MASPESGNIELLPLEGATNGIWRYLGFPLKVGKFMEVDKKKWMNVHCKLCAKVSKYVRNTSNLRCHFEFSHKEEFLAL